MKKPKIAIRQATIEDVRSFFGKKTKSLKAYVAVLNDVVVGIGGLCFEKDYMVLFSDMKEEMRSYKKDIVRGIHILKNMVEQTNYPVVAIASNKEKASEMILEKLGFKYYGLEQDGDKIFWRFP